jgi:hypothetical protein
VKVRRIRANLARGGGGASHSFVSKMAESLREREREIVMVVVFDEIEKEKGESRPFIMYMYIYVHCSPPYLFFSFFCSFTLHYLAKAALRAFTT